MSIDMTTVATSAIVSAIITCGNFLTTRYLGRILDRVEKTRIITGKTEGKE